MGEKDMKSVIKELIPYVIILITVALIRSFIVTPITVVGDSMVPNLHDNELLLLSKISYKIHDIKRYDVVVIKEEDWIIKRVIGLPKDNVSYYNGKLFINGKSVTDNYGYGITSDFDLNDICYITKGLKCPINEIPEGYYLVLGDNREISKDSRSVGLIKEKEIKGKAFVRFWPINKISLVK